MKRIEFIAPVEAMRGNLSGAQKLEYPTDNLGAYEGPTDSVNYARNYSPRFIGAKIAKSGKKYFSVRLRTANHLTTKSKKAMALLGGAGSIYATLVKISAAKAEMDAVFSKAQEFGETRTFRQYWMAQIRQMLVANAASKHVVISGAEITIKNPWANSACEVYGSTTLDSRILVKFWGELAANQIEFTVEGAIGIAHVEDTFEDIINSKYNTLGMSIETVSGVDYVKMNGEYVGYKEDDESTAIDPVVASRQIDDGDVFYLKPSLS